MRRSKCLSSRLASSLLAARLPSEVALSNSGLTIGANFEQVWDNWENFQAKFPCAGEVGTTSSRRALLSFYEVNNSQIEGALL